MGPTQRECHKYQWVNIIRAPPDILLGTKARARSGKSTTWLSAVKCQKKVTPSIQATCKKVPLPASFECIELQSRERTERETLRIGVLKHWPAKQMLRIIIFYELFRRNVFEMTRRRLRSKSPKGKKTKPRETKLWRVFHCVGFKG